MFEKHLLAHPELQGQCPTKKSLHDLYRYMEKGVFNDLDLLPFQSIVYGDILDPETEGRKIESELSVLSNALIKLEKLYKYPGSTISETAYSSEVEHIHKEQERLDQRLSTLRNFSANETGMEKDIAVF